MRETIWIPFPKIWRDDDGYHSEANAVIRVTTGAEHSEQHQDKIRLSVRENVHEWGNDQGVYLTIEQAEETIELLQQAITERKRDTHR